MKAESIEKVEIYLSNESLKVNDIQDYSILEFLHTILTNHQMNGLTNNLKE